jgi:hypothetical protein
MIKVIIVTFFLASRIAELYWTNANQIELSFFTLLLLIPNTK